MKGHEAMRKFISADSVASLIPDGSTIYTCGFGLAGFAEEVAIVIEKSFVEKGHPNALTIYHSTGTGNSKDKGIAHFAHEGLVKRIVGGHFGASGPQISKLLMENKIEGYNFPQGVLAILPREIAGRRPGVITKVGLGTFVDPRIEGGKINDLTRTKEDLVDLITLDDEEWLRYKTPKVDVAIIRATTADEHGNLTIEKDGILVESLSVAQAAKACGGIVIAQVEYSAKAGSLHPKDVRVPGILVDYILIAKPENSFQTQGTYFNPVFCGDLKIPMHAIEPKPLNVNKVIWRRAAMELRDSDIVNLGIGMPEGVAAIVAEEGVSDRITMTIEGGGVGGVPASGLDFANAINPEAIIEQPYQFDFYDGGGIDISFLGLAQTDVHGNVNVSKFHNKVAGCGGFINITQSAKKLVFCGTFSASGLDLEVCDGKIVIHQDGKIIKFISAVEQMTFNGKCSRQRQQKVIFVTERAVFKLTEAGMELVEIAPGIDLENDVLRLMTFRPVMKHVKSMPPEIFEENWQGLATLMDSKNN
jgi:propionate CoA-transferase